MDLFMKKMYKKGLATVKELQYQLNIGFKSDQARKEGLYGIDTDVTLGANVPDNSTVPQMNVAGGEPPGVVV